MHVRVRVSMSVWVCVYVCVCENEIIVIKKEIRQESSNYVSHPVSYVNVCVCVCACVFVGVFGCLHYHKLVVI